MNSSVVETASFAQRPIQCHVILKCTRRPISCCK